MADKVRFATVVRPGALTTFQDSGRPGLAHLGVPRSGALDIKSYCLANRLVGNTSGSTVLETTFDGVSLRFASPALIAVTGALADVKVNDQAVGWSMPVYVGQGARLDVDAAKVGLRSYVAVAGGFQVAPVLGSCSRDLLSGLGPPPLVADELIEIGPSSTIAPSVDFAPYLSLGNSPVLTVHPGPRRNWLTEQAEHDLFSQHYQVLPESNRIALRLKGHPIERRYHEELASEAVVWGAMELLPTGEVVVFLADHPTTGGYPVVGVIDESLASLCAQLRSGDEVRFARTRSWGTSNGSDFKTLPL
ncbi:biotin-dependent carboxyltransferase family protein [Ferrimicrobium sp.]|uniref:5-oxoprolinase subunit C family protein n=1 Tax=Ferrimicrobium sp. TaxID=2926050 RepID=UPI00261947D4|nr:biotin-dependent carboxyltransferase family protein [Ferrimicrobium sp.]